jgi:hypothetical protein
MALNVLSPINAPCLRKWGVRGMTPARRCATLVGLSATLTLAALLVAGSGSLVRFDAALVCYTFATLFAAFGVTYRWVMWLQRPPTAMYWKRGGQLLWRKGGLFRHGLPLLRRFAADFAANHFETLPDDLTRYRVHVFGLPAGEFAIASLFGFVVFHGLVWSSFLVIVGVLLALRRRLRDNGAAALQQFGEDFLPLLLLFAISVTGLLLTVSYSWMGGYAYEFLAILHAATVIFTLFWLPFGKLFHIFMRPAHLAVGLYKDAGREGEQAHCKRCGNAFAAKMHVTDLIAVERQLGYRYEMEDEKAPHYQWICPACRRALVCLAQAALWTNVGKVGLAPLEPLYENAPAITIF